MWSPMNVNPVRLIGRDKKDPNQRQPGQLPTRQPFGSPTSPTSPTSQTSPTTSGFANLPLRPKAEPGRVGTYRAGRAGSTSNGVLNGLRNAWKMR